MSGICEFCRTTIDNEEDSYYFNDTIMCSDCHLERVTSCDECGREVWTSDNAGCSHLFLCQECYDNHYNTCEGCGRTIHHQDSYYLDEDDCTQFCYDCYQNRKSSYIESYNYRPEPCFYGSGHRFLGVELEIDDGSDREDTAKDLLDIGNESGERIYIKQDGSLDSGMEIKFSKKDFPPFRT